jgi:iron complex outermembrane receptor protein
MRNSFGRHTAPICRWMGTTALASVLAATAAPAGAQTGKPAPAADVEAVVITASRIDRAFDAPTPTVAITADALSIGAPSNVAAALNVMPQFRGTRGPQVTTTNTDAGSSPVDLRGLGVARTLVLLDGRRFSSDNDLNTIPTVLIKQVDIVTGGASAAWGSGAVAGVVNVTLDNTFNGFKMGVEGGQSSRSDAASERFEAAYGGSFADGRGHLLVGGEFYNSEGVQPRTDRVNNGGWASVSNGAGAFFLSPNVGFANAAVGGLILSGALNGQAFNPNGTLRTFVRGTVVGASMIGGEGPTNDSIAPLVAPNRRYNVLARVSYDLNDDMKLTAEVRHSRFYDDYAAFADNSRGNLTIKSDNAFLPAAVKAQLAAAGQTAFTFGRFNADFATERFIIDRPTTQATLAVDGKLAGAWRYSAYYSHGEALNKTATPGVILSTPYAQAIDSVIGANGQAVCRVALTNPSTTCVPINLFGAGNVSAAAAAYVTGTPSLRALTKLDVGGFSLRGEPFKLPAGDVSIAVGAEARREGINQTADAQSRALAFGTFNTAPLKGDFTVKEAFGEVLAPIVKDAPLLNDLEFNGAARVSDYDTTGSIWSWKVGATNAFFPGFRGRFTRSRDIRSGNLTELFTTRTQGQSPVSDPFTKQSATVTVIGGGNPTLNPELANTTTGGFVWSPPQIDGLRVSVDYYKINIKGVIANLSAQDILTRCFAGNQDLCGRITRDGTGNVTQILSYAANLSRYTTDGVDADVSYVLPLQDLSPLSGRLEFRGLVTWVNSLIVDDGRNRIQYVKSQDTAFGIGVPKTRATGSVTYSGDVFSGYARARYISAGNTDNTVNNTNGHIKAYGYLDVGATAKLSLPHAPQTELFVDVTNLLDKDPPPASNFSPYYDVMGRYFTVGARLRY